jgi:adenylate cyclase
MRFSKRTLQKFKYLIILLIVSGVGGAVYANTIHFLNQGTYGLVPSGRGVVRGIIIGVLVWPFVLFFQDSALSIRIRRAPFWLAFLVNVAIATLLIIAGIVWSHYLVRPEFTFRVWFPAGFLRDCVFALSAASIYYFLALARRLIGGRVFGNVILGRYHHPVEEERIFLFLDIVDSTSIAKRLGDVGTHDLISRFFFDVDQSVHAYGGETHRYIGDEVVITWPVSTSMDNARCVECYFNISDILNNRAEEYRAQFGLVPSFRVGIHGGPVVAGECGDRKQEIVYFGDTVNTAARLQQACKEKGTQVLISKELIDRMSLPKSCSAQSLGKLLLRGRDKELEIFTLDRTNTGYSYKN